MAPKTKNTQKDDTATDTNVEPAVTTAEVAEIPVPEPGVNGGSAGDDGGESDDADSDPDGDDSAPVPAPDANIDSAGDAGNGIAPSPDGDDTGSAGNAKQNETPEERMSKLTKKVASVQTARVAVVFLGPFSRYSRGDVACFDSAIAQDMVNRNIAVWEKDAKSALEPKKDDDAHDTDIG